jgi:MFS family permease
MDASGPADPGRRKSFRLLFTALLVVGFGNTMLLAVLPPLSRDIGLSEADVGWIFSLSAFIWMFSSPHWGRESDRVGRRPIVVLGLGAYAISMALLSVLAGLGLLGWLTGTALLISLVLARAIFGTFGSASTPASQAYVADRTTPEERTTEMASLSSAFSLGAAVGTGIASGLIAGVGVLFELLTGNAELADKIATLSSMILTAILAASLALVVRAQLPEHWDKAAMVARQANKPSLSLAMDPRVSGYLIYGFGLSTVGGILSQTFGFFTMDMLELDGRQAAAHAAVGFMAGAFATVAAQTVLVPRLQLNTRSLMLWGVLLAAAGVALQVVAVNQELLVAARVVQGFGFGLAGAGYSGGASLSVTPEEQGPAAGLLVAANGSGFVLAPVFGGMLYAAVGMMAPLWLVVAILLAMSVFVYFSRRLRAPVISSASSSQPGEHG